jgi:hypothetical protein
MEIQVKRGGEMCARGNITNGKSYVTVGKNISINWTAVPSRKFKNMEQWNYLLPTQHTFTRVKKETYFVFYKL